MLLRAFSIREKEPMIKLFNTYIKSKLEYCCIVWSPTQQEYISELENIQRTFTSKIKGMDGLDYHERLKKLNMYSLERRRDRYFIIYGWQQIEGLKENILNLRSNWTGRYRNITSNTIRKYVERRRLMPSIITKIHNCPARRVERAFNCIPGKLKNITGVQTEAFKEKLDRWLRGIPDLPSCGGRYSSYNAAGSNTIQDQAVPAVNL